jgi:hypothetical protein
MPKQIEVFTQNVVYVQLQNIGKLSDPASIHAILCDGKELNATAIQTSSYIFTSATFVVNVSQIGNCLMQIFNAEFGLLSSGVTNLSVVAPENPKVDSWFPQMSFRGGDLTISVVGLSPHSIKSCVSVLECSALENFFVNIAAGDFSSEINVSTIQYTGGSSCTGGVCSTFKIVATLPNQAYWPDDGRKVDCSVEIHAAALVISFEMQVQS